MERIIVYTSDALGTLLLHEQKCYQRLSKRFASTAWTSERAPDGGTGDRECRVCCVVNAVHPASDNDDVLNVVADDRRGLRLPRASPHRLSFSSREILKSN